MRERSWLAVPGYVTQHGASILAKGRCRKALEKGSVILTLNVAFGGWDEDFAGDPVLTVDHALPHPAPCQSGAVRG